MPRRHENALSLSRTVLRVLIKLNLAAGVLILVLLVASLVDMPFVMTALGVPPRPENRMLILGMRSIMVIGVAAVPLTHAVLSRLLAMVETVRAGDPFVPANAERLQRIAWSVLGLELLHLAITWIATSVSTESTPIDIEWSLDVTRWLVVLLLFVLARVFEQGTRMRDDLEGTV